MSFFAELKKRNVIRVGAAYLVGAWLVIQIVETILPSFGFGSTPVRLVTIAFAVGFIPTLVIAWVFELTPEGLRRDRDVGRDQATQSGKTLDRMIMAGLALALAYFAMDKFVLTPQRDAEIQAQRDAEIEAARIAGRSMALVESYSDKSIAVLAFQDMSEHKDQEYLSYGIAEELLNVLAKIPELRVISRSSAFSYKGKDTRLADIAHELNVAYILEGSVRKAGDRLRITAQLIDARSDTHLWSESYERRLDDVFAIQDEIAAMVVDQLKITLLGDTPKVPQTDPEAYSLFLQARHLASLGTADGYEQSNELLTQVLAIDPEYAAAWETLAGNYSTQAGRGMRPREEGYAMSRDMAQRALDIDPAHAMAHARLGWNSMTFDNDLPAAARHFQNALSLAPGNLSIIANSAVLLQSLGRVEQAIDLLEFVTSRDPVNSGGHYNVAYYYLSLGRWDDAIASYRTALRLSPGRIGAHYFIAQALLFKGDAAGAMEAVLQEPHDVLRLLGLVMTHHALQQPSESDTHLAELITDHGEGWPYYIASVLAWRNEANEAFAWLDRAIANHGAGLPGIIVNPLFANLKADPRWPAMLESIGKAPAQLAAIQFTVPPPGHRPP
jgi:TolB-like protein/Tfp pilus assembly protein PilF